MWDNLDNFSLGNLQTLSAGFSLSNVLLCFAKLRLPFDAGCPAPGPAGFLTREGALRFISLWSHFPLAITITRSSERSNLTSRDDKKARSPDDRGGGYTMSEMFLLTRDQTAFFTTEVVNLKPDRDRPPVLELRAELTHRGATKLSCTNLFPPSTRKLDRSRWRNSRLNLFSSKEAPPELATCFGLDQELNFTIHSRFF